MSATNAAGPKTNSTTAGIIDIHTHFLDPVVKEVAATRTVLTGFGQRPRVAQTLDDPRMLDPDRHVEHMDRRGIGRHVISSPLVIQGTSWADARTELDLVRRVNDTAAAWVGRHPARFIGSFVLPLQSLDLALPEMERAVKTLSLRVANVSSEAGGLYLGAPALRPFWDAAKRLGVTVFIHPEGTRDLWFQQFSLWNSIGQSIEEVKVLSSLIYEGIPELYPDVPIIIAHGGGYLPHYMGRMDRNVTNMPDSARNLTRKPSDYLRHFYYDSCVYDPTVFVALVGKVGPDRIVMGSDYPVGELDPVGWLEQAGLFGDDLAAVAGANAARLLA